MEDKEKLKVLMLPHIDRVQNGGIRRVIEAYLKYLPEYGIEFVANENDADIISVHAGYHPNVDVLHCHGLYWTATENYEASFYKANKSIIECARLAREITVPSDWVAETFQRDMRLNPMAIRHGIEWNEWQHNYNHENYVLWNKNRSSDACDRTVIVELAKMTYEESININFISTMKTANLPNIRTIGSQSFEKMKEIVQRAKIYLSTTKETFGIGTLEAMASGVPVLGYDFGGNQEIVLHGQTGYLAKPGNLDDLFNGLEFCLKHWQVLSKNSVEHAKFFGWTTDGIDGIDPISLVAGTYKEVCEKKKRSWIENEKVCIVIPVYNKPTDMVERAIKSAKEQTYQSKVVVVDDGSDNPDEIENLCDKYDTKYIRQENQGVAIARNTGIKSSGRTEYICCLDADDWIEHEFIETCVNYLKTHRTTGIAYTGLMEHKKDGSQKKSKWPSDFDFNRQLNGQNQIPTCCVFRRDAFERVGGYRQRYAPTGAGSEDAALWTVICSIGYDAHQVTKKPLFNYSSGIGHTSEPGYRPISYTGFYPYTKDQELVPMAAPNKPKFISNKVRNYDEPVISVIIPCSKEHMSLLFNALDSLEMQSFWNWEVIVYYDFDIIYEMDNVGYLNETYPYVKFIDNFDGPKGPGYARNKAIKKARAPFLFFLDADDMLFGQNAFQNMIDAWIKYQKIIYTDYYAKLGFDTLEGAKSAYPNDLVNFNKRAKEAVIKCRLSDYNCDLATIQPSKEKYIWSSISVLIPKAWHCGFDENLRSWEDVEYLWRLARLGRCFHRLSKPHLIYNTLTGTRRQAALQDNVDIVQYIQKKFEGIKSMGCSSCASKRKRKRPVISNPVIASGSDVDKEFIEVEYVTPQGGRHTVNSINRNKLYKLTGAESYGRRKSGDRFIILVEDQKSRPHLFKILETRQGIPQPKTEIDLPPEPELM